MKNITVSIVDDFPDFSTILAQVLQSHMQINISFIANDGIDFFMKLSQTDNPPEIVLMDLSMPHMNGLTASKKLKEMNSNIKVIILTNYDDEAFILEMIEYGIEGYILKNSEISKIAEAIISVSKGNRHFSIEALARVSNKVSSKSKTDDKSFNKLFNITNRELEVLKCLCKASTAREIGAQLSISERTVETHRNNLIKKTGTKNTVELVLLALYHRVIKIERSSFGGRSSSFL